MCLAVVTTAGVATPLTLVAPPSGGQLELPSDQLTLSTVTQRFTRTQTTITGVLSNSYLRNMIIVNFRMCN